jgi:exonuclease SbcD
MKKPLLVISTDIHLTKDNIEIIKDLFKQKIEVAKKLKVNDLACLGDVFESRISQRQDVLNAFNDILDMILEAGMTMYLIPGNHDKTVYSEKESFLDPFKSHPALKLIDLSAILPFHDPKIAVCFLPFFQDDKWLERFQDLSDHISIEGWDSHNMILLTHIAVTGSKNNDGTLVSSKLSTKLFKNFYKVLSGHYHDMQKIGENFYHIPSIRQNNFGEDQDKGFTVLYSDGSHELIKSAFKHFIKIRVDLDEKNLQDILNLKNLYKNNQNNIRFELVGSESSVKSIKKEEFSSIGIDIKTRVKEIENDIVFSETEEVKEHTKDSIANEFKVFCEKEGLNYDKGIKYIKNKLK